MVMRQRRNTVTMEFSGLPVPAFSRWQRESGERPWRHWEKVTPRAPGVRSLKVLIEPYEPFLPTGEGLELSAFYVASNRLHGVAGRAALNLPVKSVLAGFGIGAYGRNGVISIPGVGTRFAAAILASDDETDSRWEWREDRPLSEECGECSACVKACPTGALVGNGCLDMERCLRAQAQYQSPPMPDKSRELIGASAWGCEICQTACLRNRGIKAVAMPAELERALELRRLLAGDVKDLGAWIGINYARPARMQARACLVAANMGRRDLICDIEKLLTSPVEPVRDCAGWALNKLRG